MPRRLRRAVPIAVAWPVAACLAVASVQSAYAQKGLKPIAANARPVVFETDVKPLLVKFCIECHTGEKAKAGLAVDRYLTEGEWMQHRDVAGKIAEYVETELMPPGDKPQPTDDQRATILRWIESRVLKIDCSGAADPGRVTIRRLNRAEYDNTIRDLLHVDIKAADDFPSDDVGYGFDNIGDVLSLSPVLLERYLAAAERITEAAILDPNHPAVQSAPGKPLPSVDEATAEFEFPKTGEYIIRARAYADQAGPEPAKMLLKLDGKNAKQFDVKAVEGDAKDYEVKVPVKAGKWVLAARFLNDYYEPKDPNPKNRDRNLHVEKLEVQGPLGVLPRNLPESHTKLMTCRPAKPSQTADCARTILKPLVSRAFRRPATAEELAGLVRLVEMAVKEGDSFEQGMRVAVQAVLVSPHFLFRIEVDPDPLDPAKVRTIDDFELATRLSYFLWSTLPDPELQKLAEAGTLRKAGNLDVQVKRMLKDPKASALVENFAAQWLQLRTLKTIQPDRGRFPQFDEDLRLAMESETKMFFEAIVREDRNILEFLEADYSYLNERLAKHYGIAGVSGEKLQRVALTGDQRGGLLGQASILMLTSNPTRTSPVKRGKWVLENLLDAPPPPPPPGVPELSEEKGKVLSGSLRQRMEQHRANPACANCHTQMDALGFGLENYDPIGAWRTKDGTFDIDASGTLPGGRTFRTPAELKAILKSRQDDFRRCLSEKLLTFALGRGLEYYDKCTVDKITRNVATNGDRFSALVLEIVRSDPFQKRRGKSGDER